MDSISFGSVSAADIGTAIKLELAGFPADEAASLETLQFVIPPSSRSARLLTRHRQIPSIRSADALSRGVQLVQSRRIRLRNPHPLLDSHPRFHVHPRSSWELRRHPLRLRRYSAPTQGNRDQITQGIYHSTPSRWTLSRSEIDRSRGTARTVSRGWIRIGRKECSCSWCPTLVRAEGGFRTVAGGRSGRREVSWSRVERFQRSGGAERRKRDEQRRFVLSSRRMQVLAPPERSRKVDAVAQ